MTRIASLYRYPVKSMGGNTLQSTALQVNGIPGDRCWVVRDEERGGIRGGKRFPALMGMQATLDAEPHDGQLSPPATIEFADGTRAQTSDADINERLSAAIGSPVTLWPLLPREQVEHYLRMPLPEGTDPDAYFREVFARTADEPLPDLSKFPAELMTYESPPGTYFDAYPLLIMSRASLASLQSAAPEQQMDVRRFRPNIVLDIDADGFPEEAWAGRTATLGTAVLKMELACPRCVMTTHGFGDLPKDPGVMRALVKHNDGNLGIYASVIEAGTIAVGDTLQLDDG